MNRLSSATRIQALHLMVEGSSLRSISRVLGISVNTVTKLLVDAGGTCAHLHDEMVRGIQAKRVQCDEIWAFCYAKRRNAPYVSPGAPIGVGDVCNWTAIDRDTRLIISWHTSLTREFKDASAFMEDLRDRIEGVPQVSTDGLHAYVEAVERAFGSEVEFGQLVKTYSRNLPDDRRYSPARYSGSIRTSVIGKPDPREISTSIIERHNLTTRMSVRRYTRLSNAFSKKLENHNHALALYFFWYNWMRPHGNLNGETPAMAANLTLAPRTWQWLLQRLP